MKLIIVSEQKSFIKKGSSNDCIIGQEKAFIKHGKENVDVRYKSIVFKNINRILSKLHISPICDPFVKEETEDAVYMYIAMNLVYLENNKHILKGLKNHKKKVALYIYDCWEPEFDDWQKTIDEIDPDYVFFCFKQTWEHYKDIYNCYWIPQSADLEIFKPSETEKTRIFIQMGRLNEKIHHKILEYLEQKGLEDNRGNYIYRRDKNELIFPELLDLVKGIGESRYIVCVPKCYENFKRTGNVSGITARYFESMACKTMIIGKKPISFDELFPEDGMVEFKEDMSDFAEKIDHFENNRDEYNRIVERNYEILMEKHTWGNRLDEILKIINEEQK